MKKMNNWIRLALVVCLMSSVMACGQKGNLYLPEGNVLTHWFG